MRKRANALLMLLICILTISAAPIGWTPAAENLRNSMRKYYSEDKYDASKAQQYARNIRQDGSWSDIKYNGTSKAAWEPVDHLTRVQEMALAYANGVKPNEQLLDASIKALRYWIRNDYKSSNWWYNDIRVPGLMMRIAYLLDGNIPEDMIPEITSYLNKINAYGYVARPGGDRIQVISDHASVALWERNIELTKQLLSLMEAESKVCKPEEVMYSTAGTIEGRNSYRPAGRGIQADLSLHHRGDRVDCTMTYGMNFPLYFAAWAERTQGTDLAFSQQSIHFLIDYYIDGICRHMVNYAYREPGSWNRELARPNNTGVNRNLTTELLKICDGYREAELTNIRDIQSGKKKYDETHSKFFWDSEYFIEQTPKYTSSVRMHSVRNDNVEAPHNSEGIKNHFRGDGACHLSITGKEYSTIKPIADYRKIPGTTTILLSKFPDEKSCQKEGKSIFVGGVSDGKYGAAAFDFISPQYDLQAKKSWFFFPNGYVCLGTDIKSNAQEHVITTIEQCEGTDFTEADDHCWTLHKGVKYQILDGQQPHVSSTDVKGTWANIVRNVSYANDSVKGRIFTMYLDHGISPKNASYAYAIIPAGANHDAADYWHIISNDRSIQAVFDIESGMYEAVFYKSGKLDYNNTSISVSQPCLVLYDGEHLCASDPSRKVNKLTIKINGKKYTVKLPKNDLAGSTVRVF